jgi:hypothetical protein
MNPPLAEVAAMAHVVAGQDAATQRGLAMDSRAGFVGNHLDRR